MQQQVIDKLWLIITYIYIYIHIYIYIYIYKENGVSEKHDFIGQH